ncbi:MAG: PIG-L family deacetylase [Bacilli bacterium]|nr:PIG-L family deacetylase [Bacilli bacterium]
MKKNKVTFISPHFDDAILSGGGAIINHLKRGDDVSVITIFSGLPGINNFSEFSANITYHGWIQERAIENQDILNSIHVKAINLDFLDAIFRKNDLGKYLCLSWSDVFTTNKEQYKEEFILFNSIKANILKFTDNTDEILYFPLSLGGHIDHLLINEIGKELNLSNYNKHIYYYEDLPYANYALDVDKLNEMYLIEKIEEIDIKYKISLVSKYKKSLEISDESSVINSHVKEHAAKISEQGKYCERFWRYRNN